MGDGEPPPAPPERGARDGVDDGAASPLGTPLALNDEHASQASKELLEASGVDLEAFLQSTDLKAFLESSDKPNFFAVPEPANRSNGRGKIGKAAAGRRSLHPRDDQRKQTPPTSAGTTARPATDAAAETHGATSVAGGGGEDAPSASPLPQADATPDSPTPAQADGTPAPPTTNKRTERGRKKKERSDETDRTHEPGPAPAAAPAKDAKEANVWTQARKVLLRQQVETQMEDPQYTDLRRYQKYYAIAQRSDYRVIPDGRPRRPITEDELQTLFLWRTKRIHLVQPPRFVDETHTLKERLMFDQIQRDLLTYSLHIDLPGRVRMPVETVKFHFYSRLLARNQSPSGPTDRVINLMADVLSISVSAASRRAILNFDRPEKRDKWEGAVLDFPFGAVTLRAGSYFEQEDKKHGIDQDTVKLLYSYFFIGRPDLALTAVYDMAIALNGGIPILKIEPIEPTGAHTLDPHMWKITLNSVDAPPDLEKTRELTVLHGEQQFNIGVHQPRLATRTPCSICLETSHFRNKCTNKATASEKRAPYTRVIRIPETKQVDHEPVASDIEGFSRQLANLRASLEPGMAAAAEAKTEADKPADNQAKPAEQAKPARPPPKRNSNSAVQLEVIIKAKHGRHDGTAKAAKPRKKKKTKPSDQQPDEDTNPQTKTKKSYFTPTKPQRTSIPMPAVGSKRDIEGLEKSQLPQDDEAGEDEEGPKPKNSSVPLQPPTRQRRTSKEQCIDIKLLDTPRTAPQFVFEHERPLERKPKTGQLTMTPFLPKIEIGDRAPSGAEIELVGHKAAEHPVIKLPALLEAIDMKEVKTPANGSCWKYALVIAQAYECGDEVTTDMKTDVKAAFKVGAKINNKLAGKVKGMIADGTVDMAHLCSTVIGKAVQHDSLKQLQDHFKEAAKQPADENIRRKFWGGEPEFKVFVEWVKEPIYVVDVMPDGACFPQWYHIADVRSRDGSVVQRAIVTGVTEAAFRAHLAVYKRNHVVPLILLLHHSAHGNTPVGHFTAARVSNATYKHWAGSKRRQADMTERLKKVIRELRGIDVNLSQHPFPSPSPPATPGSGSMYEPTDGDSNMDEAPQAQGSTTPSPEPPHTMSSHGWSSQSTAPSFTLLDQRGSGTPLPASVLSALSLDTQPIFGTATLDKLLPVSLADQVGMPCGQREEDLIHRLRALPPYDTETTRQIKQIYKSNNTAYENWKARQKKADPATHAIVKSINGPILASGALQDNVGAFVQLVQNLPYPEVHMATVPEGVLVKVGQAACCIGQAQMLHRVHDHLATSSQAFCSTWIDALVTDTTPPSTRWQLSQAADRWKRLEQATADTAIVLPERTHHGVPDAAWYKMLAYLLAVPGCLPWAFSERPLPQRCDALAAWLAMDEQTRIAQATADAIDSRDWLAARSVFPTSDYGSAGSSPVTSPSRHPSGKGGIALRI